MAARRLAEIQPESFAFDAGDLAWFEREKAKYPPGREAATVLALMRRAQNRCGGWLPKVAIEAVANLLGMEYIRALEIATFYTMFNLEPVGEFYVQLCGTTPCMLAGSGSESIKAVLEARVGPAGHVSADGKFSWIEVECLGACANAPMVQINRDFYEDLTPENFNLLLDNLAAGKPVRVGSQTGRFSSEPVGGLTTLTSLYGTDPAPPEGSAEPSVKTGSFVK